MNCDQKRKKKTINDAILLTYQFSCYGILSRLVVILYAFVLPPFTLAMVSKQTIDINN